MRRPTEFLSLTPEIVGSTTAYASPFNLSMERGHLSRCTRIVSLVGGARYYNARSC